MKRLSIPFVCVLLALLVITGAACSIQPNTVKSVSATANAAPANQTFADPFTYCTAVGTIDAPDARYTGQPVPEAIIQGYKKAAGLENSTEPLEMLQKTTSWRCMDSKVFACNVGANLPCSSKANTNKTPTQEMADFCKANENADFIPMSVTGHETIYSWHCVKGAPEILEQIEKVDAAGYLAGIWYAIAPKP